MKKNFTKIYTILFIVLVVVGLIYLYDQQNTVQLTSIDDGKNITTTKGKIVLITLSSPGDSTCAFNVPKYNDSILEFSNQNHISLTKNSNPGDSGKDTFKFKTIDVGQSDIKITCNDFGGEGPDIFNIFSSSIIVK